MVQEKRIFYVYAVSSRSGKNREPRRSLEFQGAHGKNSLIYELQMTIFPKPSIRFAIRLNRCVPCHLINKTRPLLAYFSAKNIIQAPHVQSKHNLIQQTKHHLESTRTILSHQPNKIMYHPIPPTKHHTCIISSRTIPSYLYHPIPFNLIPPTKRTLNVPHRLLVITRNRMR